MKKNDGFYRVYAHGVCPGDDEPMGTGSVVVDPQGQVIRRVSRWGHPGTKTRAEYLAVIIGLEEARAADVQDIEIRTDSELVVHRLKSQLQSDDLDLEFSHGEAVSDLEGFKHWRCRHIPEEENELASRLAHRAFEIEGHAAESASDRLKTDRDHVEKDRFYRVYAFGVCSGDPGPMGKGYLIVDPRGKVIRQASRWGSLGTKAEAAYLAAGEGLIEAEAADATRVELYTDSEVVFRQLNGEFDGTEPNLRDLHRWVLSWLSSFKRGRCVYLGREESGQAERLASAAFD